MRIEYEVDLTEFGLGIVTAILYSGGSSALVIEGVHHDRIGRHWADVDCPLSPLLPSCVKGALDKVDNSVITYADKYREHIRSFYDKD